MSKTKTKNYHDKRSRITGRFVANSQTNSTQREFGFVKSLKPRKCCGGTKCKQNSTTIVPGRLYSWQNVVGRVFGLVKGLRFFSVHGTIEGFVRDQDLSLCSKQQVTEYLERAEN